MKYGLSEKQLQETLSIIASFTEIEEAVLFGSRAIDTYKEAADVDIALKGERLTASLVAKLKFHFEEDTYLPFTFDFVVYPTITNEALKKHIDTKGVSIYRAGWKECKLEDVADVQTGPFGSQLKNEQYVTGGTPVVTVEHVNNFRIIDFDYPSVTEEDKKRLSKYLLKRGDIVFTHVGSVDLSAFVKPHQDGWMFSSRMLRVRPHANIDSRYLSYFFQQDNFREHILNISVGATMPSINTKILEGISVSFPPLPEQRAIASVLSSLDDKIDLLHRQNKTLESMAETMFRQYFTPAPLPSPKGRGSKIGKNEDSKIVKIAEMVEFNPKRQLPKGKIAPYLDMANVSTSVFHPDNCIEREFSSGMRFINGDTLLARITPCLENGKSAYVTFLENGQVGWGSTEFIVMRSKGNLHSLFTYALVKNKDFRDYAEGCLEGSSGRQRVNVNHLAKYEIFLPKGSALSAYNMVMQNIEPKLHSNFLQIRTLGKLRDTLLPKLMSGAVRMEMDTHAEPHKSRRNHV